MISTPAGALRLGVLLLAVLIGGCLAGFGYTLSRLRSQALEAGLATATTHVRNFEEHLTQTLQVVDLVMANLEPNTQPDTETGTRSAAAAAAFGSQARAALRALPAFAVAAGRRWARHRQFIGQEPGPDL
jgi:hypothetical protein